MRVIPLLIIASVILFATLLVSAGEVWPDLAVGEYDVGFRVQHEYDYSRSFKKKYDIDGNRTDHKIARPIQISIWYPAQKNQGEQYVTNAEYFDTRATEADYGQPTGEELRNLRNEHIQILLMEWRVEEGDRDKVRERVQSYFMADSRAVRGAEPIEKQFPLILFLPGYNGEPSSYTSMIEFIVSHGYVVAAIPNMGMYTRWLKNESSSLDTQARDLEFVMSKLRDLPYVNPNRVGTVGMSWGGMSNVLFAQRNHNVDAVVTLDGAISMVEEVKLIEAVPGYSHKSFNKAYLQLMQDENSKQFRERNLVFFDELTYSDAYMFQFADVLHESFASEIARKRNLSEKSETKVAYVEEFSRMLDIYVVKFLDAYLNDDGEAIQWLQAKAVLDNAPGNMIVRAEHKPAVFEPPSSDEFVQFLEDNGVDEATRLFRKCRETEPDIVLFRDWQIGPLYMEAMRTGQYEGAVAICDLWYSADRQAVGPLFSKGRALAKMEDRSEAKSCYEKILELEADQKTKDAARKLISELEL